MNPLPNPVAGTWMDSTAEWAHQHRDECGFCGGKCPAPQACQQPDLTTHHKRQRRSIVVLAVIVGSTLCAVCIAGYLRVLRWQLACLRDEQRLYVDTGHAGPIFERNTRQQQLEVMARIRQLSNRST